MLAVCDSVTKRRPKNGPRAQVNYPQLSRAYPSPYPPSKKAVVSAYKVSHEAPPTSKNVCRNHKTTATHKTRKGKIQIMAPAQPPSQNFNICSKTAAKAPASSANTQLSKHKYSSKKIISAADLGRKRSTSVTNINITHACRTQQTLPKTLTSSAINKLETKAAPRLTANEKLHNPHSGVHKALPERSTKLTEDPNVQLNSVHGIWNIQAHTGPTASATPASNKMVETMNNEGDCQSIAEVIRFSDQWKHPIIKPQPRADDINTSSNYRPISLLPVLSKILEKVKNNQLSTHLAKSNLLHRSQYAYKKHTSTQDALLNITEKIYSDIDNKNVTLLLLFDLSKAFDSVEHTQLLQKISNLGTTTQWFQSYLANCSHAVRLENTISSPIQNDFGIPQGSILGPLLFSIIINDFPSMPSNTRISMYADDVQIAMTSVPAKLSQTKNKCRNTFITRRIIVRPKWSQA
ncbi:Reverse transcriptase domain [Trinorchestia longiramus]|nr:Reverse transcriptase domain [Trinorchestia longiramus]